ncbi:MAG: MFS transporter [Flavobacteriales bacterium]|nr:MFS transporter [Flavobacteriales bacterium]
MARAFRFYIGSFSGFRREVWILAAVTFVNRAGTMVVPFLSLYLTHSMGFTLPQVGWVMSCFGLGSVAGSWLGGKLSDRIGFYEVMVGALFTSGLAFFCLQIVQGFWPFCAGVFVLMLLSDGFRPALFVAIRGYSKPENRTRAVTLLRLAINLGFSLGPAIGGLIITHVSYAGLFWMDGSSCWAAAGLLLVALKPKRATDEEKAQAALAKGSPYRDRPYLFFLLTSILITIPFLQYFSTVPVFYSEVHGLNESAIGLLLGANGLLIFLLEMPLIKYCEIKGFSRFSILRFSVVVFALSFVVLNLFPVHAFLWVGIVLMTLGEMLNFPVMNRLALDRSDRGQPGAYMALFTISWSVAHIFGHTMGLNLIAHIGFTATWWFFTAMLLLGAGMLYFAEGLMMGPRNAPAS